MDQSQVMFEVPHLDDSSSMVLEDLPTKLGHVKGVPSGKHTKNYGKIHPFFMGKLTMNGPFSIAM